MSSPRTILITGATDGLGRGLALRLASPDTLLILHGRSEQRAAEVARQVRAKGGAAEVRLADLAELRQVDRLADTVLRDFDRLDVLVNNAGAGGGAPGADRQLSADGYELLFAVNYLAGYHLTNRLLERLKAAPATQGPSGEGRARIVNVSSAGQAPIDFADPHLTRDFSGGTAYCRAKLAQILFTFDLAERLAAEGSAVSVNALHPASYMATTMVREAGVEPWSTVDEGVDATMRLVTGEAGAVGGRYFNGTQPTRAHAQAYDPGARQQLRALSAELIAKALA
ncbi:SDR family NAD(P)-dependent oxidoreductase [Kitasatospora acidiphila]|uniref:SDR family NAD(P)-dependent oxidoreductase n=1 Tax=Kitasatospora acidiphila TaxID=2567942 RepID=A0A540VZ83_9ACTN|nr:SDR family NAD(P)-dependent oxidoreductase [Kitasatospora acidiphila]TQF02047.1 SDR family NAD(P)-dependent oxidoreductase [Kitasatospora acidiphila]